MIGRESRRQIKTEVIKRAVGRERRKEKRRRSERRRTFKPSLEMAHVFQASYHGYAYQRP